MQSRCPEILLNCENLIKLKAVILFQKLIHLVVPRHGNVSVLSNSPAARLLGSSPGGDTNCLREHVLPRAEGQGPPVSPSSLLVCADSDTSPELWGRPFIQPEGRMQCPSLLAPYLCLKMLQQNHAQPDRDTDGGCSSSCNGQCISQPSVREPEPAGHWRLSGRSPGCWLQMGFLLPQEKLQYCFYCFSVYWKRPTQIIEDHLLYLKSTDCRC